MNRVDIRLEAVKIAIKIHAMDTCNVVETAKIVENYIIGDADIPEYEDPKKILKDMVSNIGKMTNNNSMEENIYKRYGLNMCVEKDNRENGN